MLNRFFPNANLSQITNASVSCDVMSMQHFLFGMRKQEIGLIAA
jgi:hypothetical protein